MKPWTSEADAAPIQRVPVAASAPLCPAEFRDRIIIDTPHDGDWIPPELLGSPRVTPLLESGRLLHDFRDMRDWGADAVANALAEALGVPAWYRVRLARVVLDFNRLPGSSPAHVPPLERFAISGALAGVLAHGEKRNLLERHYDRISDGMEQAIGNCLIKVAIHTYDEHNPTKTRRPGLSLLSRSDSYQRGSRLPDGLFDPLFPDQLVESTVKRILRDRVALTLEKAGFDVAHNYPYCLPDGSLEVRCQPWFFFQQVRAMYEAEHPHRDDLPHRLVWEMLLNTNHRRAAGDALFGYLHRYQAAPEGQTKAFEQAQSAYAAVGRFVARHPEMGHDWRMSPTRTSALCVEVRKDLVCDPDTGALKAENARRIGRLLAEGLSTYLSEDRA